MTVKGIRGINPPGSLDEPLWGDMSASRRFLPPDAGPFSFPFVLSAHGTLLLIPEWEWDTGVGFLLGEQYRLLIKPLRVTDHDGSVRYRHTFTLTFPRNGFKLELIMDEDTQKEIAPTLHWPQGDQCDYHGMMTADELLAFVNKVLAQTAPEERWN